MLNDRLEETSHEQFITSTAPGRILASLPMSDMLRVKLPSMEKTTHSVFGGTTAMNPSADDLSPLTEHFTG